MLFLKRYLILLFVVLSHTAYAVDETLSIEFNEDIEIDILSIGNAADTGIIWFTCHQGEDSPEYLASKELTPRGYQVFLPDILSAHFLSATPSNISKLNTEELLFVVKHIINNSSTKRFYLIGAARSAVPVLKILSDTQLRKQAPKLKGALLITPRVNKSSPVPGSLPIFVDETGKSTLPIYVLEGERTPNRWGLPYLTQQLAQSGSHVTSDLIKGVRGFFYLREEKTPQEAKMSQQLPSIIQNSLSKIGQ